MPTNAEMFETLHNWHIWTGADYAAREADAEGRHASAEQYRVVRDQRTVDPLHVLATTQNLIESLTAGRWDAITEARLRGATWDDIARAMSKRADDIRNEYAAMVEWLTTHRPDFVGLARYRASQ